MASRAIQANALKAVFAYELYDEPHQGNPYPHTCTTVTFGVRAPRCEGGGGRRALAAQAFAAREWGWGRAVRMQGAVT